MKTERKRGEFTVRYDPVAELIHIKDNKEQKNYAITLDLIFFSILDVKLDNPYEEELNDS